MDTPATPEMSRIEYLYRMATVNRLYRDGRISQTERGDRIADLIHQFAQVDPDSFDTHVQQALAVCS